MDREELRGLLQSSYVLFSCEGTAEAVCIEKLVEAGSMVVPRHNIVDDPIYFTPYTRLRKADEIADRFLRTTFEGDGVSGLTICRVVDSRSARFNLPRRLEEICIVASLFTRPEIEMLVIHAVGAYDEWSRASRRNRGLKPSEFCKGQLRLPRVKEGDFLKEFWDTHGIAEAIRAYDARRSHATDELSLGALLV